DVHGIRIDGFVGVDLDQVGAATRGRGDVVVRRVLLEYTVEGEGHRVGVEVGPVVELDAFAQMERPGEFVGADRPVSGQAGAGDGDRIALVVVDRSQLVVDLVADEAGPFVALVGGR